MRRFGGDGRLANGLKDVDDGTVMGADLALELIHSPRNFLMRRHRGAQLHECAYDVDRHFDGMNGVQHGRCHDSPVFGKYRRRISPAAPT